MWQALNHSFKQRPTSKSWQQYTIIFYFCILSKQHIISGSYTSWFLLSLSSKSLSYRAGIVFSNECCPSMLHSPILHLLHELPTKKIPVFSFFPAVCLQVITMFRKAASNNLLKYFRYYLQILLLYIQNVGSNDSWGPITSQNRYT